MLSSPFGFPTETLVVFSVLSIGAIIIDLLAHRNKAITLLNASMWSCFWIMIALLFAFYLYLHHGSEIASLFITGYALEKALSVDNLFVIMSIFSWFSVPNRYRHSLLYWGVIGAIVFRGIFVLLGTELLLLGPWMEFLFACIVALTGVMMLKNKSKKESSNDYSNHFAYRLAKNCLPSYPKIVGNYFFLTKKRLNRELAKPKNKSLIKTIPPRMIYVTPLFLCLVVIELSDVMFAFDSVPAIIAVSREPLIVYSAMMFAILGLRTMYFVLEALKMYLVHLDKAIISLLFFISLKLALNASDHLLHHSITINPVVSLYVVLSLLLLGVMASFLFPKNTGKS